MVRFSDLSGWLRFAVIVSWATAALYAIYFLIGLINAGG